MGLYRMHVCSCNSTSTFGNIVYQTPSKSIKDRDTSAVFICTHNIASYFQIMWYKETQGTLGFKLMGNLSGEMDQIETEFKNKIKNLTVHSTGMTQCSKLPLGSLKVNHLEPDDSGIYFCAVSEHSVSKAGECCTKTFCA
uniref:Immunoglobulin V-set domain-containing protein n=1 Tax=Cyprinus carpio carpio TaxID=630221 RepID=A0A9J7ZNM6_CYPCA